MRSIYYKLDGHTPTPCTSDELTAMYEAPETRRVAQDVVTLDGRNGHGQRRVSTVFLGIDHNFSSVGPPILFETMVFGPNDEEGQWRYVTWEEAEAGHKAVVEALKNGNDPHEEVPSELEEVR